MHWAKQGELLKLISFWRYNDSYFLFMANDVHITCDMGMIAYEKCLKKSPSQFSCTKSDIYDHLEARWYCSAPVMSHSRTYSRSLKDLFMFWQGWILALSFVFQSFLHQVGRKDYLSTNHENASISRDCRDHFKLIGPKNLANTSKCSYFQVVKSPFIHVNSPHLTYPLWALLRIRPLAVSVI